MDTPISTPNSPDTSTVHSAEEETGNLVQPSIPEEHPLVSVTGDISWLDSEPLPTAVRKGDLAEVQCLLEQEPEALMSKCARSLVLSVRYGHLNSVKYLLEFIRQGYGKIGAPDALHKIGGTRTGGLILKEAVYNQQFDIVLYFLEQRIHQFSDVVTEAVKAGNFDMVKRLVDNIKMFTPAKKGVLDEAAYWATLQGCLDVLRYLVEKGANIHVIHRFKCGVMQENALIGASRRGHLEIVIWLVEQGADIHANNNDALLWAVQNNHVPLVHYLAEQGADIHMESDRLLHTASYFGSKEVVQYLVEHGADIHTENDAALVWACQNDHQEIVEYLVQQGADIYAQKKGIENRLLQPSPEGSQHKFSVTELSMNGIIFTLNPQNYSITNLKQQRANRNQEAISLQKMVDDMFGEGALGEEEQN